MDEAFLKRQIAQPPKYSQRSGFGPYAARAGFYRRGCEPFQSIRGTMHIVIATPMGFAVLFAILAFSYPLSASGPWAVYAPYSKVTFAVGVAVAVITVALAEAVLVGVFERAPAAAYLQWYVVMGTALIRATEYTVNR